MDGRAKRSHKAAGAPVERPQPGPEVPAAAWRLVEGGYDLHVHVEPDIIGRSIDDLGLARAFLAHRLQGFALKSHYAPTAERAAVVRRAVPGVEVIGTITLNHGVGGVNPVAVEIAGRAGARIVWLPTVDSLSEARATGRYESRPGASRAPQDSQAGGHDATDREMAHPPPWVKIRHEMASRIPIPAPLSVLDDGGRISRAFNECLEIMAHYGMILATGHIGRAETFAAVEAARARGLRHIVITHPDFPTARLSTADQVRLAGAGAVLEYCFTTYHTAKAPWAACFANIRAAGVERCIITTDLGQPANPPAVEGLPRFAMQLLEAGFTESEVRALAVTNPARLVAA